MPIPPVPTRQDEAYRYADLAALTPLWPVALETRSVPANAQQHLTIVHDGTAAMVRDLAIDIAAGARFALYILNAGAGYGRIRVRVSLGEGADFTLGGAQIAAGDQILEIITDVAHHAPRATSRQMVRSVAAGHATVNYLGKVHVATGADGTDGEQSVRAMILDRTASANAKPELEIYADDVKCAHGCAVGELDAGALFYLAQRGLDPAAAKRLMLQAFVAEAFADAPDEAALIAGAQAALAAVL